MSAEALAAKPALGNKYELIDELGHGGMATVYRARDPRLDREVAVKVIHKHLRDNPEVGRRFVVEARAAAAIRHPGIVEVFDVSEEDDPERFLVVELIRGPTLREHLTAEGHLPAEVAAAIVLRICDAVAHAHRAGVVHRDIKPENILLDERTSPPTVKITDFGIAKMLDGQGMTATGQVLGSPAHMAPEQIEAGEVDERTDVFALGVLLFECTTGSLPFEGKSPAQVLRNVLDGRRPSAESKRPEVGKPWSRVIDEALARNPADRTPSAEALAKAIRTECERLGFNPEQELGNYFLDCAAYRASYASRVAERLVELAGRSRGIAALDDYGRALALQPGNPRALRALRSAGARAHAIRWVKRAAIGIAGAGLVGVAGRVLLQEPRRAPVAMPSVEQFATRARAVPAFAQELSRPATNDAASRRNGARNEPHDAPKTSRSRPVMISVIPPGAELIIDGSRTDWFGRTLELPVGSHRARATVPNSRCCKALEKTIEIEAGEGVQRVVLGIELLPATVALLGAPAGGQLRCDRIGLSLIGSASRTVRLPEPQWAGRCEFLSAQGASTKSLITLRAGEENLVAWKGL